MYLFVSDLKDIDKDSTEFSKIVWRQKHMQLCVNEVVFRGNSTLPEQIRELDTPAQIFTYFFTPEIMSIVAEETNRCAVSQDINTSFSINVDDIYKYIGIHLYMSI